DFKQRRSRFGGRLPARPADRPGLSRALRRKDGQFDFSIGQPPRTKRQSLFTEQYGQRRSLRESLERLSHTRRSVAPFEHFARLGVKFEGMLSGKIEFVENLHHLNLLRIESQGFFERVMDHAKLFFRQSPRRAPVGVALRAKRAQLVEPGRQLPGVALREAL